MTLAERIAQLRRERKMSQEDLAEALLVSRQSVSKWENGLSNPDTENLIRLAEIFQVDVNLLTGSQLETEEKPTETTTPPNQRKLIRILSVLLAIFVSTAVLFSVLWAVQRENELWEQTGGEKDSPWEALQFYVGDASEEVKLTRKERKELYQLVHSVDSEEWTVTENPEKISHDSYRYVVACQIKNANIFLVYTNEELWNVQIFPGGRIMLYRTQITPELLAELQQHAEK